MILVTMIILLRQIHTSVKIPKTVSARELIETVGEENVTNEMRALLNSSSTTIVQYGFYKVVPAHQEATSVESFDLHLMDYLLFTPSITHSSPFGDNEFVEIGLENTTYNCTYGNEITSSAVREEVFARLPGTHRIWVNNNTSQTVTVSMTYFLVLFNDGIDDYNIFVAVCDQMFSNWCWAASTKILASYYGFEKTVPQIVYYTHGNFNNDTASESDYPIAMQYATDGVYTAIKENSVRYNQNELRIMALFKLPFMMLLGDYSSGSAPSAGHATVFAGIDTTLTYVRVSDPANGGSMKIYDYSYIANATSPKRYYATVSVSPLIIG